MSLTNTEIVRLLQSVKSEGIHVLLEDDTLKLKVKKGERPDKTILDQLKEHKSEIISFLSAKKNTQSETSKNLTKRRVGNFTVEDAIPLSFPQERLWVMDKLEGTTNYHLPSVLRITGELDHELLSSCFKQIIDRHESLRTIFLERDGVGYQQLLNTANFQIEKTAVNRITDQELKTLISNEVNRAFDLSKDYMLRANVLKLASDSHVLIVVMHHIAGDGWSVPILVSELEELYNSKLSGKPATLPELPVQYADYSIWQREHLLGETLEKRLNYWEDQLQQVETLELPLDFNRPATQSNNGANYTCQLQTEQTVQLNALAKEKGTTLFMLLLTLYKILLHRYTQQEDICVGVPVANRSESAISGLIGFFVNTIALRSTIAPSIPFTELLNEVKQTVLGGYTHQEVPFEKVVERVVKGRDTSRTPLVQTLFSLQNNEQVTGVQLGDATITFEEVTTETSKFDLTLDIVEVSEGLEMSFDYCTDLFKEETIIKMASHFKELIASVLTDIEQPIGRLSMLSSSEKLQLLEAFNPSLDTPSEPGTVVDVFRAQASITPEAVAITFGDRSLTYEALDAQSDKVAHHLQAQGYGPGSKIVLHMERSLEMLIGILGIMKSGHVYVPVDVSHPKERLDYIIEDSGCEAILVSGPSEIVAPTAHDIREILNGEDITTPALEAVSSESTAYVIYTSGTTGKPKGVMVSHHSLHSFTSGFKGMFTRGGRQPVMASNAFDIFLFELFNPLLSGGTAMLLGDEVVRDPELLLEVLKSTDSFHAVPSLMGELVATIREEGTQSSYGHIKELYVGGDRVPNTLLMSMREVFPDAEIHVFYGPTESTVVVSCMTYQPTDIIPESGNYIGRPTHQNQIVLLDVSSTLTPIGVTGELCVSGPQVSMGYLNRESLTEEKFIANPYGEGMLYRTGDLARWTSDGVLEFLGRKDRQVKVRGYRIEPGEVERGIAEATGIEQVLVMAREVSGSLQLVSYLVTDKEIDSTEIIRSLEGTLPGYMVPRFYIGLEALPLTRNRKVDHKALPEVDFKPSENIISPTNETEESLLGIWSSVLGIGEDNISTTHNFFELGGDSIKAIQLVSRAKNQGVHFKAKDVFEHQTISRLSANLPAEELAQSEQGMLDGELGLLPIQRNFFTGDQPHPNHYNQSVLLELDASISKELLADSLSLLVEQHDALRIGYEISDGEVRAHYTDQRAALIEERIGSLSEIGTRGGYYQSQLDITTGEVCRFVLFEGEGLAPHLLMVIHHLSVDGVSWRILLEDLENLLKNEQHSLGPKGSSYRQWQEQLAKYAQSAELLDELDYWMATLNNYETLPTDHDHSEESTLTDIEEIESTIDNETTRTLLQDIHHSYGTGIDDILLSVLSKALCDHSGKDRVVVSLEGHGREDLFDGMDITRTMGWFTTVYPVLLENRTNLSDLIADTKDRLRSIPNKGIGFGVLRHLSKAEGLDTDFSDIVFNYLGDFDNSLDDSDEALLTFSSLEKGSDIHSSNKNPHKLGVTAMLASGELRLVWTYDSNYYKKESIEALSAAYQTILKDIIRHCTAIKNTIKTPSDYGLPLTVDHASLQAFKNLPSHADVITDISTLSPLQEGMLFHSLYDDDASAYVTSFTCDFIGGLDAQIFRKSWEHITSKHSILRTGIFADELSVPVQCVYKKVALKIEEVDYTDIDESSIEAALDAHISKVESEGFTLEEAPLFSFRLIHLPDDRTRLLMKNHHILWDGWSLSVLMGEFVSCYENLSEGRLLPAIDEDHYGDFIHDIKSKSKGTVADYWKDYLLDISHPIYLPFFKKEHLRNKTFANRSSSLDLGATLTTQLKEYAAKHHLTLNTMIQGAWSYLLSRYTGEETVVFGATVSGRDSELENIENGVGLYINTIPVCSNISEGNTVKDWLDELQKGHTTAREEYSHISLNEIQGYIGIQSTPFDTLLVFENYPVDEALLSNSRNLSIANIDGHEYTNYVLTLGVGLFGESISIKFDHNKELFDANAISMLQGHFKRVLESIASGASQIKDLQYMTPSEKLQLLEAFNPSLGTPSEPGTVVDVFRDQASITPEALAVTFGDRNLTYEALDAQSDKVAHHLQTQGYGPESKIVLHMERSLEMLIGILGIMKSGHVYAPVDVSHPKERLNYIIEDSGCEAVLCTAQVLESLGGTDVATLNIEELLKDNMAVGTELSSPKPSAVAYIIYTSGTTGKPKGVMVSHQSLHSFTSGFEGMFTRGGRQPVMASNAFDIFLFELFNPLLSGGTAMLLGDEVVRDPELLLEVLKSTDNFHAVPSLMGELVATIREEGMQSSYGHIKELYVGGDRVPNTLLMSMREVFPDAKIHVFYGPTESTVVVSCMTYEKEDIIPESGNYIGRPTHENQIVLLDASSTLTPIGVTGELCVSGPQVSMGYLNREELTAEKFIDNSYGEGKVYRTGDLARWTSDGVLEFLGRKDRQVKVRGYRIEPGEVERAITEATGIDQVLVVAKEVSGSLQLVSYLVMEREIDKTAIIQSLEGVLPNYMVPRFYIGLDALPLTRNGKIDYKNLSGVDFNTDDDFVAPSSTIEKQLADIWSSVLKIDSKDISTTHNFFEIGGDSIKAMRLLTKVNATFDTVINLTDLFEHPTISNFFSYLELLMMSVDESDYEEHATIKASISIGSESGSVIKKEVVELLQKAKDEGILTLFEDDVLKLKVRKGAKPDKNTLTQLEEHKSEIISFLRFKKNTQSKALKKLVKRRVANFTVEDAIPMSFPQERLWVVDKLEGTTNYHLPSVLRVTGTLNHELLSSCFKQIIERHESLRTVFLEKDGVGYQQLLTSADFSVEKTVTHNITDHDLKTTIGNEVNRAFDLSRDYMLRVRVFELASDLHVLTVVMHHIAGDGWSVPVLVNELEVLYNAERSGKPTTLTELPIQYADYSIWQREHLSGETFEKRLNYWKDQLQGVETLELPIDFNRPATQSIRGASYTCDLDAAHTAQLKAFAKENETTLFMLLLTLYKVLLHRYTNQEDICVGVPVANRSESAISGLIGFFVNTIALRSTITSSMSFAELLTEVKQTVLGGYAHQDVPFEKVVERVVKGRDPSRTPLVQTLFSLQNNEQVSGIQLGDAKIEFEEVATETSKFDLTIDIAETPKGLQMIFNYCTDLFKAETIARMASHFKELITSVLVDTKQSIGKLSILTPSEELQLLETFNPSFDTAKNPGTVVDLFKEQAINTPEAVAVTFEEKSLTYQELDMQSKKVAHYLQAQGFELGTKVVLHMERSLEMLIGILGILKSGYVYVPVDVSHPKERLDYIIADSGCEFLLGTTSVLESLGAIKVKTLKIEELLNIDITEEVELLFPEPSALAYIIYTSGTTGKPKGVMVSHQSLHSFTGGFDELFIRGGKQPVMVSNSFDIFLFELFNPLLSGGTAMLLSDAVVREPELLLEMLKESDSFHAIPSLMGELVATIREESTEDAYRHIQELFVGGDKVSNSLLENTREVFPDARIHVFYGPTESTVVVSCMTYGPDDAIPESGNAIGRPIHENRILLLDEANTLSPIGVTGELCVNGPQVSMGYLNRKELTQEKFIDNPYGNGSLYRTGDLARWTADGVLEFLGRKDRQVKVRGYRIEPGEVERAITEATGIDQVLVVAREVSGSLQLVSYLVTEKEIDKSAIISSLEGILPNYMVPRFYMGLEALPLTQNGKVDYKSLPGVDFNIDDNLVPPSNTIEKQLVNIWSSVLQIDSENIGITHNFFELGGDSIKAIQMVSRAKTADIHFKVKDVFEHQTISRLSANLTAEKSIQTEQGILDGELGLLPIQRDFFESDQPHPNHYNQSVLLELDPSVSKEDLSQSLTVLVEQHDALRIGYEVSENDLNAHYIDYKVTLIEEQIASLSEIGVRGEYYQSDLDITKGDVYRFVLFRGEDLTSHLLIIVHHLSVDGVSWRILLEDFEELLKMAMKGEEPTLPSKGSSYRQWQQCLAEYAKSKELLQEHGYWQNILKDHTSFPNDSGYEGNSDLSAMADIELLIDQETTRSLLQEVHYSYGTETNDILLSALSRTLSEYCDKNKVVISLEGHGREDLFEDMDITRTVGWFTTVYPVLLENKENLSDLIAGTKDRLRSIPKKGMSFGVLRHLTKAEDLDKDFSDIVFNYLGDFDNSLDDSPEALLKFSSLDKGSDIHKSNINPHKLSVNGMLVSGSLRFVWIYDSNQYKMETIEALSVSYQRALEDIISHCKAVEGVVKTPSDYGLPLAIDHASLQTFKELPFHQGTITDISVLSPLQEGMLFHSIYGDNAAAYVTHFSCDFIGGLDPELFRKSWDYIANHHSILRTGIHAGYFDTTVQCVYDQVTLKIDEVDYRNIDSETLSDEVNAYVSKIKAEGFIMEEAPLFSFNLIHLPDRTRLLMKNHHILWDGWSLSVLMGEFVSCYTQLAKGNPLPILRDDHYGTFIRELKKKNKTALVDFWKDYLQDVSNPTHLPFFKEENLRNKTFANSTASLNLGTSLTMQLKEYVAKYHLTLNTIIQGAWSYLLSRYTGEQTVVFGATVSGRDSKFENIEKGVGLYINTIPVCTSISEDDHIDNWLNKLQKGHTVAREEYGHISLNEIQRYAGLQTTPFDSLLVFENYPVDEALNASNDLSVSNVSGHEYTNYVLTLGVGLFGESITIKFDHNKELFGASFISMLQGHFKRVLESMVSGVSHIKELSYITPGERLKLLEVFNPSLDTPNEPGTIIDVFKTQVANTPEAIAVALEAKSLTYKELDMQSDKVAHYLQAQGFELGAKVVLHMERSLEMLIGILGILKSGYVYVPVDVSHPRERLDFIIEDSGCEAVLGTTSVFEYLEGIDVATLDIEELLKNNIDEGTELASLEPSALAYIIYTSGTTGKPKGVMVNHQSLYSFTGGFEELFIRSGKQPVMASNSFDIFLFELFNPLLSGGTAMLLSDVVVRDPELLLEVLKSSDSFHAVPSLMGELVATIRDNDIAETYAHIRELYVGGDRVPNSLLNSMREVFPKAKIHVFYGPTESTVVVSCMTYGPGDAIPESGNLIGRPIHENHIVLLDASGNLTPIGVTGELCVSGPQVSMGYLNREELTKEKFIVNPDEDGRLYRTGDLARWTSDGVLEFLGRKDRQVKIRGYRIEPGEVERCIQLVTGIEKVLVMAKEVSGSLQLVSYLVTDKEIDKSTIIDSLGKILPNYMIPRFYIELEDLPLTRNGKVDYKELPEVNFTVGEEFIPPSNMIEKQLIDIWSSILQIDSETISITHNFFELGGDSIKAITLQNKVKAVFDIKMKLEQFFKDPSVRGMSQTIAEMKTKKIEKPKITI